MGNLTELEEEFLDSMKALMIRYGVDVYFGKTKEDGFVFWCADKRIHITEDDFYSYFMNEKIEKSVDE